MLEVRILILLDYQVVSSLKETIYSFTGLVRLGIGQIVHGVEKYQTLHFTQYTEALFSVMDYNALLKYTF